MTQQQWGNSGQGGGWPAPGSGQQGGWGQPSFGQAYGQQYGQPQQRQQWAQPQGHPGGQQQWGAPQGQPGGQWPQQQHGGPQQGQWGAPQPKKKGGAGRIVLMVLGVVAVGFVALTALSSLSGPSYQNEDYRVPEANSAPPPLPEPKDLATADRALTQNPLYAQKVAAPVRCDMQEIDVATADDAALKAHFESQMGCLMRVWGPVFDSTKTWKIYRPTVTIYGEDVSTPCGGRSGVNAFYCPANQQVYYSRMLARAKQLPTLREPKMVDLVMAHEFGHAIQGRSGILASMYVKADEENLSKDDMLWLSRRNETQADCFSGMWLRSTAQSRGVIDADVQNFYRTLEALGDDSLGAPAGKGNHGLATSRRYWGQLGMSTDDVGKCNTWVAPKEQVR